MNTDYLQYIERIELNPTEICNLSCSLCPRGHGYPNKDLHMSLETCAQIKKHLDDCSYSKLVSITGRGEPTLTKNFRELLMIILENARYKCYMYTNGKKLDEVSDLIPRFWRVYVDVYDKSTSVYTGVRKKWEKFSNVRVLHKPDLNESYFTHNKQINTKFSNRGGYLGQIQNNIKQNPCAFVFQKIFINWNGDYNLCCDDWKEQLVMSNVYDETIEEYVNTSPGLKRYRDQHIIGERACLKVCSGCDRMHTLSDTTINTIKNVILRS